MKKHLLTFALLALGTANSVVADAVWSKYLKKNSIDQPINDSQESPSLDTLYTEWFKAIVPHGTVTIGGVFMEERAKEGILSNRLEDLPLAERQSWLNDKLTDLESQRKTATDTRKIDQAMKQLQDWLNVAPEQTPPMNDSTDDHEDTERIAENLNAAFYAWCDIQRYILLNPEPRKSGSANLLKRRSLDEQRLDSLKEAWLADLNRLPQEDHEDWVQKQVATVWTQTIPAHIRDAYRKAVLEALSRALTLDELGDMIAYPTDFNASDREDFDFFNPEQIDYLTGDYYTTDELRQIATSMVEREKHYGNTDSEAGEESPSDESEENTPETDSTEDTGYETIDKSFKHWQNAWLSGAEDSKTLLEKWLSDLHALSPEEQQQWVAYLIQQVAEDKVDDNQKKELLHELSKALAVKNLSAMTRSIDQDEDGWDFRYYFTDEQLHELLAPLNKPQLLEFIRSRPNAHSNPGDHDGPPTTDTDETEPQQSDDAVIGFEPWLMHPAPVPSSRPAH